MKKEIKFNPWEVLGRVDYGKLVKEFGVSPIRELPKMFEKEVLFRRNIIFAHRDIQRILENIKSKKQFVVMTGLMPTGKFHIGHMLLVKQLVFYQKLGVKIYVAVADIEAYHARGQSLEESRKIAFEEYIPNYLALGLKPKNCEIYFQSNRSNDGKKAGAYYALQNLLARYANFNEFKSVYGDITPGKMVSALLQASDMLHPQLKEFLGRIPVLVPVGIDQDPHLRLARDISRRIKNPSFIQLSSSYNLFIPGLAGDKMSSSNPNSYISMTDDSKDVERKIKKYAFSGGQVTLEEHKKKGGNPNVDVAFQYLRFGFEPDDKKLEEIYRLYKQGEMSTGQLKDITIKKINSFLKSHQNKLKKITKGQISNFFD